MYLCMSLCISVGVGGLGSFDFICCFLISIVFNLCKALCTTFLYEKCHTNKECLID